MMTEKRKNYTAAFKRAAVDLVTVQGYSLSQASRRLDLNVNRLRRCKHQLEEQGNDAFPGTGHLMPEQEALNRLRQEHQRLRMERHILKKRSLFLPTSRLDIPIEG
jgi:transposase